MQIELRFENPQDETSAISINAIGSEPAIDQGSAPIIVEVPDGCKIVSIDAIALPDGQYITGRQVFVHAEQEVPGFRFV